MSSTLQSVCGPQRIAACVSIYIPFD